jgi:hypothetical protein
VPGPLRAGDCFACVYGLLYGATVVFQLHDGSFPERCFQKVQEQQMPHLSGLSV